MSTRAGATNLSIPPGTSPAAAATQVLSILRPVCGALVGGVVLFAAVVGFFFVEGTAPLTSDTIPGAALLAAAGLAAAAFVAAPVVERRAREAPRGAPMAEVALRYQTGTILGFALREGPGLMGLALALVGGTPAWAAGFALASVIAMLAAWPRRDDLEARLRRASAAEAATEA